MKSCNLNVLLLENSLLIKIVNLIRLFEFNYLVKTNTRSEVTYSMEHFDLVQTLIGTLGNVENITRLLE